MGGAGTDGWFSRTRVDGRGRADPARSSGSTSTTAAPTRCRTSRLRWIAACWPSWAATAWARRRCATPSPAWSPPPAASGSPARRSSACRRNAITAARHRLRAAGPARLALAHRRRASAAGGARASGAWTIERIYATVPAPRRAAGNGGAELSGGEQQMLAIGRALLLNPRLLVMDEPTEGLAPVIVEQVAEMLKALARRGRDRGAADRAEPRRGDRGRRHASSVMVNGRIARSMPAARARRPIASCSNGCSA